MKKVKISTIIKGYLAFPIILAVILAAVTVTLFVLVDNRAGLIGLAGLIVYVLIAVIFIAINQKGTTEALIRFGQEYQTLEKHFINDLPLPYIITDSDGNILIRNSKFAGLIEGTYTNVRDIFKELIESDLKFEDQNKEYSVKYDGREYRLHFDKLNIPGELAKEIPNLPEDKSEYVLAMYMFDDTEIINLVKEKADEQVVIGSLYVDNYNEVLDQVEDVNKSLVTAMIDREILNYFANVGGLVKKVEKDKYFIIFRRKTLPVMQSSRFDLLDAIRNVETGSDMSATISMGVGVGNSYVNSQDLARLALELALGRGGDQVVIKDGERTYFYGGKTKSVEKNSRVKARVKSLALREIIMNVDKVFVMGHKIGDMDCLGASVGIYKAARTLGKKAYILLDELNNTVMPALEHFLDDPDYGDNIFIQKSEAAKFVDDNTALVIVDVSNPEIFDMPELVTLTKTIVIIDHHLQNGAKVENVAMSYIEPTASSASEMVTELLQYISPDIKLKLNEAEALYAGILIDTNFFSKNTGVRTFEAAAYLRKSGLDVAKVKGMFNDTLEDFKAKAETIKTAEIIEDEYAIAFGPSEGVENPTIVAAQVANELLDISGINASFVLVEYDDKIYISARSTGKINVQLIMERMGGGGHMNTAGAQLRGDTLEEAERKLKITIRNMKEEGVLE